MNTNLAGALLVPALVGPRGIGAQAPTEGAGTERVVFEPLLADPQEPQFFATYLWAHSPRLASRLGSVGFGQTIGLVRGRDWQEVTPRRVIYWLETAFPNAAFLEIDFPI